MRPVTYNKICPRCGRRNINDASFCGRCNNPLGRDNSSDYRQTEQGTQVIMPATETRAVSNSSANRLDRVAKDLSQLRNKFDSIRESQKGGGLFWHLIQRHVEAYELQEKISEAIEKIENINLIGYAEMHAQIVQAHLRTQAQASDHAHQLAEQEHEERIKAREFRFTQGIEDERLGRELNREYDRRQFIENIEDGKLRRKISRFAQAVDHIEACFLTPEERLKGIPSDAKKETISRLVKRVEEEIFNSTEEELGGSDYLDELKDLA